MDITPLNYGKIYKSIGYSSSKGYENWIKSDTGVIKEPITQCKKIIATDDESINCHCWNCNHKKEVSTGLCSNCGKFGDTKLFLPKPSNEFLKKYCELGGINKVLVEYEAEGWLSPMQPFKLRDNESKLKLKVSSDNTIIIK